MTTTYKYFKPEPPRIPTKAELSRAAKISAKSGAKRAARALAKLSADAPHLEALRAEASELYAKIARAVAAMGVER